MAVSASGAMPFASAFSAMAAEGGAAGLGKGDGAADQDQPVEFFAVADGERQADEAAEAVAEDVGLRRQPEFVEEVGDAVGIAGERLGRRRGAKARHVDQGQASLRGKAGRERGV